MDVVIDSQQFEPSEVTLINYARLYLDVHTISDIAEANGKYLDTAMIGGKLELASTESRGMGVNQPRPTCTNIHGDCGRKPANYCVLETSGD